MVLRYAATAASGCVAATLCGGLARCAATTKERVFNTTRMFTLARSQTRKLPGHTHTDGCVANTQTFHRQMVGGEAITDRAAAIAAANPVACTLGSCAIPAPTCGRRLATAATAARFARAASRVLSPMSIAF